MGRTFAVGDVHGDLEALHTALARLPTLTAEDTVVFLGDYVDRGPHSAQVVEFIRHELPARIPGRLVTLMGNHEHGWLRTIDEEWLGFVLPQGNGTRECMESYVGEKLDEEAEFEMLLTGKFFPDDVIAWMRTLPAWYEDEHAIYVHAGLVKNDGKWLHPSQVEDPTPLLWTRAREFMTEYRGKPVVVGHTVTNTLPQEISLYTPEDDEDLFWAGESAYLIDTGAGKGGFLTVLELPSMAIYESRDPTP